MKIAGWVMLAIGAAVVAAGVVLGMATINRQGVNCGSGFGGVSDSATVKDIENAYLGVTSDVAGACQSAVSDRDTIAMAAVWPGGILAFAGVCTLAMASSRTNRQAAPEIHVASE